jgi:protein TonB
MLDDQADTEATPMRELPLRSFSQENPAHDSWLARVRENLAHLLLPAHFTPSSANGAPLHLLKFDKTKRPARAQAVSLLTHAIVIAGILLFVTQGPVQHPLRTLIDKTGIARLTYYPPPDSNSFGKPSLGNNGGGGEQNPNPATHGFFPHLSSIQLAAPRVPHNETVVLPVPDVIFDPHAATTAEAITKIGLPWMPKDTNSAGPGKDGIGNQGRGGLGDEDGPDAGSANGGPYANVATMPACSYCPNPTYTDDARHAKVQGTVTLRVLVGTDGRTQQIRIVKGIGFGLDDRALETIRGWRFIPAKDASRKPTLAWITVETIFRLF